MKIVCPKENEESRVALIPATVKKFVDLGASVIVESGVGESAYYSDEDYQKEGAQLLSNREDLLSQGDLVLRLRKPSPEDISVLKKGALHVSYLDPFNEKELVQKLASQSVSAFSMEMIPRSTRAQKMDALSSQASLAGYVAVMIAAEKLDKVLPMMMTPAGTITPSRVFVIGAGVAGLQAIATAKRLGARVEAFDTRPVVEEQVQSLGAKFVKIDLGDTGQTKDGYAKELTPEQITKQREGMKKHCSQADVVITTAQLFGRKAPVIVTKDMVEAMSPGSVLVDLAAESGGNVEGSVAGEEVNINGVRILGFKNLPGRVSVHASQMYSSNLFNFVSEFWDKEKKEFVLNREDEIIKAALITHGGEVVNETIKNLG